MTRPRQPSPPPGQERWKLIRDILLTTVGVWMLVWQTLSSSPQPLILGAALALLGLPAAIRAGESFRP